MKREQKKMQVQFGQSIKRLRAEAGISRRLLADRASIDVRLLARYEAGKVCPSVYAAAKIAQFFCVEIRSMFDPVEMKNADS